MGSKYWFWPILTNWLRESRCRFREFKAELILLHNLIIEVVPRTKFEVNDKQDNNWDACENCIGLMEFSFNPSLIHDRILKDMFDRNVCFFFEWKIMTFWLVIFKRLGTSNINLNVSIFSIRNLE